MTGAAQLIDLRVQLALVDLVDAQSVTQFKVGDGMLTAQVIGQDAQEGPVEAARQVDEGRSNWFGHRRTIRRTCVLCQGEKEGERWCNREGGMDKSKQ